MDNAIKRVMAAYPDLPEHTARMVVGAVNYPGTAGGFFQAIADNDLGKAVCKADLKNQKHFVSIALIVHRDKSLTELGKPAPSITVLDIAIAKGAQVIDGSVTLAEIERVGLPFSGGCFSCEASIAAWNAYPCTNGYLACKDCIADGDGFDSIEAYEQWEKEERARIKDAQDGN